VCPWEETPETKESSSFLKKRTKKLLLLRQHLIGRFEPKGGRISKSFLLLFFKKEVLSSFLTR
jgi:hypothetical protein